MCRLLAICERGRILTQCMYYITIFDHDDDGDGGGGGVKRHVHATIRRAQYKIECNIFNHNWITCVQCALQAGYPKNRETSM